MEKRLFIAKQAFDRLTHYPGNRNLVLDRDLVKLFVLLGRETYGESVNGFVRFFLGMC